MNARHRRIIGGGTVLIVSAFAVVFTTRAQTPGRSSTTPGRAPQAAVGDTNAEREQIWNSSNMLRARAWLQDYCSKSARVTPEECKKYATELENMTPTQMKLWLLKFDHEEEQRQQQYAFWQRSHEASISHAQAMNRATQQAYANINRAESQAAQGAQQQINEQAQASQEMSEAKQLETTAPYNPYGYNPGYGGLHYHVHLYPYGY